jgi:hypothetical protein
LAAPATGLPTSEDAQAVYDAARFRFEHQERNRERFSARVRQLLVGLTVSGAITGYFANELLIHFPTRGWWWMGLALSAAGLGVAFVAGLGYVLRLFRSADYDSLPSKMHHQQVWTQADYHHRVNQQQGYEITRKALMLEQMADGLHDAVEHNVAVDEGRQKHLDRAKLAAAASAGFVVLGFISTFAIRFSALLG